MTIEERKDNHLDICLNEDVGSRKVTTLLEDVFLIHQALPELDLDKVELATTFLGHKLNAPLLIDSMTGGTKAAGDVNRDLAVVAEEFGLGIGVGSQRAGLMNPQVVETYSTVRKHAPNAFIYGNLGGAQLVKGLTIDDARKAVEMIQADALAIHLNPLQEAVQVGGEASYWGVLEKIEGLTRRLGVPVIIKEVGAGISREAAAKLAMAGASAINVAGVGGTSWAGVESVRAKRMGEEATANLGETFWDWGLPTAAAILEVRPRVTLPLIASGGLRTGVDAAKAIALGADLVAVARPFLQAALKGGTKAAGKFASEFIAQLRLAMFLTGSPDVAAMKRARYILTGKLLDWKFNLGDVI